LRGCGLASPWHNVLPGLRRSFESHDIAFAARVFNHYDRVCACRNRGACHDLQAGSAANASLTVSPALISPTHFNCAPDAASFERTA